MKGDGMTDRHRSRNRARARHRLVAGTAAVAAVGAQVLCSQYPEFAFDQNFSERAAISTRLTRQPLAAVTNTRIQYTRSTTLLSTSNE